MINAWWPIAATVVMGLLVLASQRHSAYLARKLQIRIEKHHEDPSFPLEPPPSKLRLFLREYGIIFGALVFNICSLAYEIYSTQPMTALRVLNIALLACFTVYWFIYLVVRRQRNEIWEEIDRINLDIRKGIEIMGLMAKRMTGNNPLTNPTKSDLTEPNQPSPK